MAIFPALHKLTLMGFAASFGALLVGWLVVVGRGLYLARHLLTLFKLTKLDLQTMRMMQPILCRALCH